MARRQKVRSRLSLGIAVAVTGTLFYSMLTWGPASAADHGVDARLNPGFEPQTITVAPGDTVTWTNKDTAAVGDHDIVADDPNPPVVGEQAFDGNCPIAPGESCSKEINPDLASVTGGEFGYHCSIHPEMTGTIEVDPEAEAESEPTSTASGSATASPTATGSPTSSPTGSPSPTASDSPSPLPSITPLPPTEVSRRVSLNLEGHLRAKGRVRASGEGGDACIADVDVNIQKKRKKDGWKTIETTQTRDNGKYATKIPDKKGRYRAKIAEETRDDVVCSSAKSDSDRHKHDRNRRR
ncbi:MAG: plastocyanin/azurin family copper-binding protein [Actinomycetota bacterium]